VSYRVIQWATGHVGRQAIRGIVAHPDLELAGCWVHSEDKVGRDVGEICGIAPIGVPATNDVDRLLALDADCVVYSPLLPDTPEVVRILESGKNVVTPLGWFYPKDDAGKEAIEAACHKGAATLHGTGIHPGGITEQIPLLISSLSRSVTSVRAEEFSDIRAYRAELVVREVMLFGKTPEEAAASPMLALLAGGFHQSIDMIADALGFELDRQKASKHEMAVATARIATPIGVLERGTVAAQRFTWQGLVRSKPVITARVNWLMGQEHLDPPWTFGAQGERFEIEVQGEPSITMTLHGLHPRDYRDDPDQNPGLTATAMHCVNAVPYACEAPPGIRTYLQMPFMTGRADAALAGRAVRSREPSPAPRR
jgi:hypothetical protein